MSKISLDLSQFKAAGVYTLEYDQSQSITVDTEALRLIVGFSAQGPFNTPVYLSSSADRLKVFGDIDTKLEKKGCYFNRMTDTLLQSTPVFALNLLNVNTIDSSDNTDKVGYVVLNTDSGFNATDASVDGFKLNESYEELYYKFFNRERFWTPSSENLESLAAMKITGGTVTGDGLSSGQILSISNTGTKTFSVLVIKPSNLSGYNVTAKDWYGSATNIPYKWIRPNDYISNYFIQVVAVEGDWTNYEMLSKDPYWQSYFNEEGLKPGIINSFANDPGVNLIGSWTGSLIPDFTDKTGSNQFIENVVNNSTQLTGLLLSVNRNVLDILDYKWDESESGDSTSGKWVLDADVYTDGDESNAGFRIIDLIGHELAVNTDSFTGINVLSYKSDSSVKPLTELNNAVMWDSSSSFVLLNPLDWNSLTVGDYVKNAPSEKLGIIPGITPITNKTWISNKEYVENSLDVNTYFVRTRNGAGTEEDPYTWTTEIVDSSKGWMLSTEFLKKIGLNDSSMSEILINAIDTMFDASTNSPEDIAKYKYVKVDDTSTGPESKKARAMDPSIYKLYGHLTIDGIYKFTAIDNVSNESNKVVKVSSVSNIATGYNFIALPGLKLTTKHLPGYDKNGAPNLEEGVEKIYSMLDDQGILRGLTNPDMINFRYVIDSMGYGLRPNMGGKVYLSKLAMKRGKCTAILNAPSITQFANSTDPCFCDTYVSGKDPKPVFSTEWIPEGGNPDMQRSFQFSLPAEDQGAKYAAVFGPYLKYNVGGRNMLVPPAADVANAFIRKFQGGDPYVIVANMNGILSNTNLAGVEYDFDITDRSYLEPFGYNSIINRNNNIMIYSNRTAYQTVKSDYNYLHVRELLNTIEIEVDAVLQNYVFDYNNAVTRMAIVQAVTPILQAIQDSGAIYAFTVVMDSTNNTDDIINEAFAVIDIGLEIAKGTEKIIQRITVYKTGGLSSGSNTTA